MAREHITLRCGFFAWHTVGVAAAKKRLPVVQSSPDGEPEELRPPWHWVGFGTIAIFAVWLPLTWVASRASAVLTASLAAGAASEEEVQARIRALHASERARYYALASGPHVVALALAAMGGGYLVGRWGSGSREAALAGVMAGVIASVLATLGGGASFGLAAVIAIASTFAWLGGKLGARRARP